MRRFDKGLILVTSLWIMGLVALLAVGIGYRISIEMRLSKYNVDRLSARYLAKAGLVKAQEYLSKDKNSYDTLYECGIMLDVEKTPESIFSAEFNRLGNGLFSVHHAHKKEYEEGEDLYYGMMDEERKININMDKIPHGDNTAEFRRILNALFSNFTEDSIDIVNAIIDWQDGGDFDSLTFPGGAEDFYYETEYGYSCKDAGFETVEELLLVKGMDRDLFDRVKDHITVYSNGKININTASKEVLGVIIDDEKGTYTSLVNDIIDFRKGTDGREGTEDDRVFTEIRELESVIEEDDIQGRNRVSQIGPYLAVKSENFRILSHGKIGRVTKTIDCVVMKEAVSDKIKIKYYHEG
ncbi:general secretion pathway protein GspK [Candidatus Omnitrophota bacterium]